MLTTVSTECYISWVHAVTRNLWWEAVLFKHGQVVDQMHAGLYVFVEPVQDFLWALQNVLEGRVIQSTQLKLISREICLSCHVMLSVSSAALNNGRNKGCQSSVFHVTHENLCVCAVPG